MAGVDARVVYVVGKSEDIQKWKDGLIPSPVLSGGQGSRGWCGRRGCGGDHAATWNHNQPGTGLVIGVSRLVAVQLVGECSLLRAAPGKPLYFDLIYEPGIMLGFWGSTSSPPVNPARAGIAQPDLSGRRQATLWFQTRYQ